MSRIGTIIQYCSNEYRFLDRCIQEAKIFSDQILITTCSHFFDGTPENRSLLNWTYLHHPDLPFVETKFDVKPLYIEHISADMSHLRHGFYWHACLRHVGFQYLSREIDAVLFLDADEIAEGGKLAAYLQSSEAAFYDAHRFAAYFYDLTPDRRANALHIYPLLVRRSALESVQIHNLEDRCGMMSQVRGRVLHHHMPMFHHYCWTRSEAECRRKAATWGHRNDADWNAILDRAFSEGTLAHTLFQKYAFETVTPYFDPLAISLPTDEAPPGPYPNVRYVDAEMVRRREVLNAL